MCQAHGRLVLARVVDPTGLGRVGELLRFDEVPQSQLDRVHLELVRQTVDDALHEIDRFGDAEGAGVGHPARRLVRIDGGHLAVGRLKVVAAGEHTEEPGRVLHGSRRTVERAVIGEHVGANGEDLSLLGGRDLTAHDVVAGESRADEVLRTVLHPLDRLAQDQRRHDGADVARIDRDLVAETTADVRGDHPDLVLGQARHQRVHRPVGVRGLGGGPQRQLAGDPLVVGHAAARLHRRRVHPRVDDVLAHHDVGRFEDGVGGGLIAGLPVEAVVVGLALEVVTDNRHPRVESPAGVDDRVEDVVLDLDQLQRVPGRVTVLGHDEGHLLALEADLVGGQHRLHVVGQGRHPGQTLLRQGGARHDRLDLGMGFRRAGIHADDPGVRHG